MQNLFVTPAIFFHPANFLLKGFAISLKIQSAYCVLFDHNQDLFTLLTIQINIFVGRDKRRALGGEVFDDHNLNAMKIFNHESTQFGTYRIKCNNHLLHMQSGVWYGSIISCCARNNPYFLNVFSRQLNVSSKFVRLDINCEASANTQERLAQHTMAHLAPNITSFCKVLAFSKTEITKNSLKLAIHSAYIK